MKANILLTALATTLTTLSLTAQTRQTPPPSAESEDVDSLAMPGYTDLDELVIEAQRPVLQSDGAKTTYNVDEDPAAESSTVLDMLKKVPMVSVDGDGNVRLNGSGAFKFQLNGLDNPMLNQYSGQILQAMPAAAVVKIEVITEPGAKEDAEGSSGIINIVTERTVSQDGYSGNISLRATNRDLGPSIYGVMKKDKVTISANANYQWGFAGREGGQNTTTTYLNPQERGVLKSDLTQKNKHQFVGGNIDMSWEPNSKNLFNVGANAFYVMSNLYDLFNTTSRYDIGASSPLWSFSQAGEGKMNYLMLSGYASYRHNFGENNYLVLSYLFNFGKTLFDVDREFTDRINYYDLTYDFQKQRNHSYNRGHTAQIDYSNDFGTGIHTLDVGAKGIFRRNSARGSDSQMMGNGEETAFEQTDIMQPQDIYAAYASYTGKFNFLTLLAGLRYEHTTMGVTNHLDPKQSFRTHLNDWVPNAALTWSFSAASNLRLAYQMRISRPSISQVNPFSMAFSPYQQMKGNPDLTSERIHKISLTYSAFDRIFGGNVGLEYTTVNNAIDNYYFIDPENPETVISSYANIGHQSDIALRGFFNWNIISHMSLSLNGRVAYNRLKAPTEGYRNHGWDGNIGGAWNYQVADVYKFSAYAAWYARSIELQGYGSGFYYYGISASRDFLADKSLTLGISANNFLQRRQTFKSHRETPEMIFDSNGFTNSSWSVGVSLTWKFGKQHFQVKKTGVDLDNDDISSASNSSSGGGGSSTPGQGM